MAQQDTGLTTKLGGATEKIHKFDLFEVKNIKILLFSSKNVQVY